MTGGMNAWQWETAPCEYSGGSGTADDPYQIATAADLNGIGARPDDWDKHFILTADIDLSVYEDRAGRNRFTIIGKWVGWDEPDNAPFSGVLDGGDHVISHLTLVSPDHPGVGLFACLGASGAIRNARLEEVQIDVPESSYVGALVGWSEGTITNCQSGGKVSGREGVGGLAGYSDGSVTDCRSDSTVSGSWDVGGLVGINNGQVTDSSSAGSVSGARFSGGLVGSIWGSVSHSHSTCVVAGDEYVGGLAGDNDGNDVIACYSTGAVSGVRSVGGLLGNNVDTVMNCYSTGAVSGTELVGGLIGDNWEEGEISHCYSTGHVSGDLDTGGLVGLNWGDVRHCFWDVESSGQATSARGTGKSTTEMQTASTFRDAGWDFNDVWTIWEGYDYPRLRWAAGPKAGLVFVDIPGGTFAMGDHYGVGEEDERPVHVVRLDSFRMSKYETTNAQYAAFLNAAMSDGLIEVVDGTVYPLAAGDQNEPWCRLHSYHPEVQIQYSQGQFRLCHRDDAVDMSDHPVHRVSWYGAQAFCDHYGYRLPTEAEWEYAARGGYHDPYYMYPWGSNDIDPNLANYDQSNPLGLSEGPYHTPVGYYGAYGAYGLCDMSGNMLEWCGDTYGRNYYSNSPVDNPTGVAQDGLRAQRGGSLDSEPLACRVAERYRYGPTHTGSRFGFRVCTSTGSLEF